mgnify:CR=1 FL=1
MADLSITAADVEPGANATLNDGVAGETITRGKAVYKASSGKLMIADADAEASAKAVGIAVQDAGDNQPIQYQSAGCLDIGAAVLVGEIYVVSDAAGICVIDDTVGNAPQAGQWLCVLGVPSETDELEIHIDFADRAI